MCQTSSKSPPSLAPGPFHCTVKPVLSGHSKRRPKISFLDSWSLNVGQKYCRMLQGEHSAIFLTFIKLLFVFENFVLSIFEWPLKTGFTVLTPLSSHCRSTGINKRRCPQTRKTILLSFLYEIFQEAITCYTTWTEPYWSEALLLWHLWEMLHHCPSFEET